MNLLMSVSCVSLMKFASHLTQCLESSYLQVPF